jgi:hypothetical protein
MPSVPIPSRAICLFLFLASGLWTALVALDVIGVVWLVAGPVLTGWAWLLIAMFRQRGRVHD